MLVIIPVEVESLEQVSLKIRAMRKSSKISQEKLAKLCGLSQSTIARIEKDITRMNPSYSTIYTIISTLNAVNIRSGSEVILRKRAFEIMHRNIVFVKPSNTIQEAIDIFKDYDFQQLPVLDSQKRVVGTIYQKDLLSVATLTPDLVRKKVVASAMKAPLPQIDEDTEILKIKPLLENWDAIMVVENGRAIGIVTIYDILKNV